MTRDEISALLPFLANGTLEGTERAEVQDAVTHDPELAAELEALKAVRATIQAEESYSPGEMGLARLMRDVDAETQAANANRRPLIWQIAAAILLALVVGQTVWQFIDSGPGGYQLAGDTPPAFTAAFRGDVTEAELRSLLLEAGVEIVSGPSALGLYALAPLEGVTREEARAELEASDLVETLETAETPD